MLIRQCSSPWLTNKSYNRSPKATCDLVSKFPHIPLPHSHVTAFWAFGNWPTFMTVAPHSHVITIYYCFAEMGIYFQLPEKKSHNEHMGLLNDCQIHLTTSTQKVRKIGSVTWWLTLQFLWLQLPGSVTVISRGLPVADWSLTG